MAISKNIVKGLLDLIDKAKKEAGPFFDEQAPDVVEQFGSPITGYHYSRVEEPMRRLSADMYGTGAAGQEVQRLMRDPDLWNRSYFYPEGARPQQGMATPRPEPSVRSGPTYRVMEADMYNLDENPLGFTGGPSDLERQVKGAGFAGLYRPSMEMAVTYRPTTEAQRLGGYRAEAEAALARAGRLPDNPFTVTAENIPSTETEFGQWLSQQGMGLKERYTDEVDQLLDRYRFMNSLGVRDYTSRPGYGSYMGSINPNTVIQVPDEGSAKLVADARGLLTMQDAVPYYRTDPGANVAGMRVIADRSITPEMMRRSYGQTGMDFTRTDLNTMDILNFSGDDGVPFSGVEDPQFTQMIADVFENARGVKEIERFKATSQYNPTDQFWKGDQGVGLLEAVPDLAGIQEVINRYNKSFRSQHGFVDPRIPAALASAGLGSAAINVIMGDLNKGEESKPKGKGNGDKNTKTGSRPAR
jgi:hypothetical protein